MYTVIVKLTVLPDRVEEFLEGIRVNARSSLRDEPGCLRFDVHRSTEHDNEFFLYEIYADEDAFYSDHRTTSHYSAWREVVAHCVLDGGHVNTFATPAFPHDIPEAPTRAPGRG